MTLIDTHAHVDAAGGIPSLAPIPDGHTSTRVIAVTNLPSRFARVQTSGNDRVQWALGLHPGQSHPRNAIDDFISLLPTCVAIGEIGLDSTTTDGPHGVPLNRQRDELDQILTHPETARRFISIHSRRSVNMLIEHLRSAAVPGAVLHWFTGTPTQARRAAETGAYFSLNAKMARKTELLTGLPRDRILLETDAPYTGKNVRPGDLGPALDMLAQTWNTDHESAQSQVLANQRELFASLAVAPFGAGL